MDSNKTTPDYFNFDINQIFDLSINKYKDSLPLLYLYDKTIKGFYWKCCGLPFDSIHQFDDVKPDLFCHNRVMLFFMLKNIRFLEKENKITYSYLIKDNKVTLYIIIPELNVKNQIRISSFLKYRDYLNAPILNADKVVMEYLACILISHLYGWALSSKVIDYDSKNMHEILELDDDIEYKKCLQFHEKFNPLLRQEINLLNFENQSMGIKGNSLKVGQFYNFFEKYRRELQEEFLKIQNHPK